RRIETATRDARAGDEDFFGRLFLGSRNLGAHRGGYCRCENTERTQTRARALKLDSRRHSSFSPVASLGNHACDDKGSTLSQPLQYGICEHELPPRTELPPKATAALEQYVLERIGTRRDDLLEARSGIEPLYTALQA